MCVCHVHQCRCMQKPVEGVGSLEDGGIDIDKLPKVNAGTQSLAFSKSSQKS